MLELAGLWECSESSRGDREEYFETREGVFEMILQPCSAILRLLGVLVPRECAGFKML